MKVKIAAMLIVLSFICNEQSVIFEVLTVVSVQITVLRDVMPCALTHAATIFMLIDISTEDFIGTFFQKVGFYKL